MQVVWIIIGGLGALAILGAFVRYLRGVRPTFHGGEGPATPLERIGWIGLWVTLAVGCGLAILVAIRGASGFAEDDVTRRVFTVLLLVGIAVWAAGWRLIRRRSGGAVIDERDRDVLARSFSVESVTVIVMLVAWTVILTEVYGDEGSLPLGYLQLIFWSTFVAGAFGRSLGIILGYRREPLVDA